MFMLIVIMSIFFLSIFYYIVKYKDDLKLISKQFQPSYRSGMDEDKLITTLRGCKQKGANILSSGLEYFNNAHFHSHLDSNSKI